MTHEELNDVRDQLLMLVGIFEATKNIPAESDDDESYHAMTEVIRINVPKLLAYINELESMPLVKMAVELQEENERMLYALQQIESFESDVDIYQRGAWFGDMQRIARHALEGDAHATL